QTLLQAAHACHRPGDAGIHLAAARKPAHLFVVAPDGPAEVDAPVAVGGIEGNRLEGDAHLRHPALLVDARLRLPDAFPVAIDVADVLVDALHAHAVGVDLEDVAAAAIQVGVEHEVEDVVIGQALA